MNPLGAAEGTWHWRLASEALKSDVARRLREMVSFMIPDSATR